MYWLFPVTDPSGSAWEAGWLSSPLWYLRALLWLMLAAPLLLRLVRRAPWATFTALIAVVFALDVAARHPDWPLQQTRAPWLVGDFALYAIFVALGFLHRDGRLAQLTRRTWAVAAAVTGAAAAAWVLTQPVHDMVVNDSHPAHLLIGFAWLALSLSVAPLIEQVARRRHVANVIAAMNSRSMTVYLWHSTAIIVGYQLLWRVPFAVRRVQRGVARAHRGGHHHVGHGVRLDRGPRSAKARRPLAGAPRPASSAIGFGGARGDVALRARRRQRRVHTLERSERRRGVHRAGAVAAATDPGDHITVDCFVFPHRDHRRILGGELGRR